MLAQWPPVWWALLPGKASRPVTNEYFLKINERKTTICLTGAKECPFPATDQNNNVVRNVSKVYDRDLIDLTSFGK
jgi:hypothetical protein